MATSHFHLSSLGAPTPPQPTAPLTRLASASSLVSPPQPASNDPSSRQQRRVYKRGHPEAGTPSNNNFNLFIGRHQVSVVVLKHQGVGGKHPREPGKFYFQARTRNEYPQRHIWSGWATREEVTTKITELLKAKPSTKVETRPTQNPSRRFSKLAEPPSQSPATPEPISPLDPIPGPTVPSLPFSVIPPTPSNPPTPFLSTSTPSSPPSSKTRARTKQPPVAPGPEIRPNRVGEDSQELRRKKPKTQLPGSENVKIATPTPLPPPHPIYNLLSAESLASSSHPLATSLQFAASGIPLPSRPFFHFPAMLPLAPISPFQFQHLVAPSPFQPLGLPFQPPQQQQQLKPEPLFPVHLPAHLHPLTAPSSSSPQHSSPSPAPSSSSPAPSLSPSSSPSLSSASSPPSFSRISVASLLNDQEAARHIAGMDSLLLLAGMERQNLNSIKEDTSLPAQ